MNSKPKILVVDDKPENLVALRTVLKDLDVDLVETTSGNDALKATLHHEFTLALLDIQMPEMDGYELAAILREEEKTAQLPFIFISAVYTDNLNVFKGYEKGAFSFITKPFQPEILVNKVNFFIDKHKQSTTLYRLNEELKNINQELESFSYSVSHDLRAPLRAISGYATMLDESMTDKMDQEEKRMLDAIRSNAKNMGSLIDDLLAFSKMGRKEIRKSRVDLNSLVNHALLEIDRHTPHKARVSIGQLPTVWADQALLLQVVLNLLSNAVKYSAKKDQPEIQIVAEEKPHEIIFSIRDNGAGFNMEFADKLFGVFQRLHSSDSFEGTGVGLAIVQRIITRHGGRVWAEGKVDQGAVFYFALPAGNQESGLG